MKLLSEALGEALALVEKATDRKWEHIDAGLVLHDPDVSVYCGHIATFVEDDDAEAAAASINFLRQHGPAIAAVLRAVEGDAWQPIETAPRDVDVIVYCFGAAIPQRIAMLCEGDKWLDTGCNKLDMFPPTHWRPLPDAPLDAAGSAEGVEGV